MKVKYFENTIKPEWERSPDTVFINVKDPVFSIHGLYAPRENTPFIRMPRDIASSTNAGVADLCMHTAGGRALFMTDSPYIAVYAKMPRMCRMDHMPRSGSSGFDVYIINEDMSQKFACALIPEHGAKTEYKTMGNSFTTFGKTRGYVINFPLYDVVEELYIGLSPEAELLPFTGLYINEKPAVFYGSSITQGACASRPGLCYENFISRRLRLDYINLGFSGSGKAEDIIVDYMASLNMSLFVSDYDHNAPDEEYLEKTHHKMYEKIRLSHPDIPYIMISKPDIDSHPQVDARRREIIRRSYEKALSKGDKNVYFIDGETLFGSELRDACLVDGTHPNDIGHMRMGKVIGDVIAGIIENK